MKLSIKDSNGKTIAEWADDSQMTKFVEQEIKKHKLGQLTTLRIEGVYGFSGDYIIRTLNGVDA